MTSRISIGFTLSILASLGFPTASSAQSVEQRIRAATVAAKLAPQFCAAAPAGGASQTVTLSLGAQAKLAKFVSWLANLGLSGAVKYQNATYQGVLQKDLAKSIRDSNNCRQNVLNKILDAMVIQNSDAPAAPLPSQSPIPTSFDKPSGSFINHGQFWIETPEYAPGQNFTFTELGHDKDYVYLVDRSRTFPGTTDDPMIVRLPVHGGWAQWTYQSPPDWKNFNTVTPATR